jgi:ferrous iron transport protein A
MVERRVPETDRTNENDPQLHTRGGLSDTLPMSLSTHPPRTLSGLQAGQSAVVDRIDADDVLARRLLEIGFYPGAVVELVASMWPAHDPVAVRVGGATFALRRQEAERVKIR